MSSTAPASYHMFLHAVRLAFDAHAALLFLPDENGRFSLTAANCPDNAAEEGTRVDPGKGLIGWILRNREPLQVNNFDQRSSHIGCYEPRAEARITAFMGCPLPGGGVLCVDSIHDVQFLPEHMELLEALGQLLDSSSPALAADNDDVRRCFTRLERIQDLRVQHPQWRQYLPAFLQLIAEATQFDHVAFAARVEGSETYVIEAESSSLLLEEGMPATLPIAGGVAGWVFRNDIPVHTEGLDGTQGAGLFGKVQGLPQFQAVVCLPVTVNKSTSAVLCLGSVDPRPIPQALRSFIRMAVDELVQFLETLYLRHRVRTLMPKARIHRDGALAYNPDTAPQPLQEED